MQDSPEDDALLQRVSAGDRGAFEQLFHQHRAFLLALVDRRLDNKLAARFDASDVVQEAQLEAFDRLEDFLERRPMPFRLWLLRTTLECLQKIRRFHVAAQRCTSRREQPLPDRSSALLADHLMAGDTSPSQRAQRHELAARVRRELSHVSETDREVVLLRIFEGLSNAEVACMLEIEPEAAKKR